MSFYHLAGVTTPGAPDEIVDFFATFEAWITGTVGWTVEAGAGTTDLILRSVGELGGLTKLYFRIWRDGGAPNHIRVECRDDLAGTHVTNEAGFLDSGGVQFAYWISADLDAVQFVSKVGAGYQSVYVGLVLPFALTIPDETYAMIVTSRQTAGSILRDHAGLWDRDYPLYDHAMLDHAGIDEFDGSVPLCGTFFNNDQDIAGQLKHISGAIFPPALTVETLLTTGRPGATTTWIVLQDLATQRFAMRTGGVLPTGFGPPPGFAHASGVAANIAALWTAVSNFLTPLGWSALGDPGYHDSGGLWSSPGVSGEEEIFVALTHAVAGNDVYVSVQDDAVGTHRETDGVKDLDEIADFPLNYWISGDADCFCLVIQRAVGYTYFWMGMPAIYAPGLMAPYAGPCLSAYSVCAIAQGAGTATRALLRQHSGVWYSNNVLPYSEGIDIEPSNPNSFDGVTYLNWPVTAICTPTMQVIGQMRYLGYTNGGGVANLDTITIGAEVWTVFFDSLGWIFTLRTA